MKKAKQSEPQEIPPAIQVFSKTRDIDSANPYHLDGDVDMYSEEKIKIREELAKDPAIKK